MKIRPAEFHDVPLVNAMVARSIRALHAGYYIDTVIDSAIEHAYGVDWQLIRDRSYYVVEIGGALAGVGGWSGRETIAGAHGPDDQAGAVLDPSKDAARIRAFYVDPLFARRGVAALLLQTSEVAAREAGFVRASLTSTLPAVPFYRTYGYEEREPFALPLPDGAVLDLVLMEKELRSKNGDSAAGVAPGGL